MSDEDLHWDGIGDGLGFLGERRCWVFPASRRWPWDGGEDHPAPSRRLEPPDRSWPFDSRTRDPRPGSTHRAPDLVERKAP